LREAKKLQKDASLADERGGKVACFNKKEDNSPPQKKRKRKKKAIYNLATKNINLKKML
jgi:hypothetical protein